MSGFTFGSYATLGTGNQTIAAESSTVFGTIDNAGKTATEISVEWTNGSTAGTNPYVQVERDIDGTNFEAESDAPWLLQLPTPVASTTQSRVFTVDANLVGKFRVRVVNPSDNFSITGVTVRYKQSTYA